MNIYLLAPLSGLHQGAYHFIVSTTASLDRLTPTNFFHIRQRTVAYFRRSFAIVIVWLWACCFCDSGCSLTCYSLRPVISTAPFAHSRRYYSAASLGCRDFPLHSDSPSQLSTCHPNSNLILEPKVYKSFVLNHISTLLRNTDSRTYQASMPILYEFLHSQSYLTQ